MFELPERHQVDLLKSIDHKTYRIQNSLALSALLRSPHPKVAFFYAFVTPTPSVDLASLPFGISDRVHYRVRPRQQNPHSS